MNTHATMTIANTVCEQSMLTQSVSNQWPSIPPTILAYDSRAPYPHHGRGHYSRRALRPPAGVATAHAKAVLLTALQRTNHRGKLLASKPPQGEIRWPRGLDRPVSVEMQVWRFFTDHQMSDLPRLRLLYCRAIRCALWWSWGSCVLSLSFHLERANECTVVVRCHPPQSQSTGFREVQRGCKGTVRWIRHRA